MACYLFNFTKKGSEKGKPLRDQAAALLKIKLWGIGPKTPNKDRLAPGDRILAYVGAPEKLFIGEATISNGFHDWTPGEATAYMGKPAGRGFPAGVTFSEADVWDTPVPLDSVWSKMPTSAKGKKKPLFLGVRAIKREDFETVLAEAAETPPPEPEDQGGRTVTPPRKSTMADDLYKAAEKPREFLAFEWIVVAVYAAIFLIGWIFIGRIGDWSERRFGRRRL